MLTVHCVYTVTFYAYGGYMNDSLIKIVASQMGIPGYVVDELKASKPRMTEAFFNGENASLVFLVESPQETYNVLITLPLSQLKRIAPIYNKAVILATKG